MTFSGTNSNSFSNTFNTVHVSTASTVDLNALAIAGLQKELHEAKVRARVEILRGRSMHQILEQVEVLLDEWTAAGAVLDGQPSISIADIVRELSEAISLDGVHYNEIWTEGDESTA